MPGRTKHMTYSISTTVAVLFMHTWAQAAIAGFIATGVMEKIASVVIGFESRIRNAGRVLLSSGRMARRLRKLSFQIRLRRRCSDGRGTGNDDRRRKRRPEEAGSVNAPQRQPESTDGRPHNVVRLALVS